jgi:hypothetical protein
LTDVRPQVFDLLVVLNAWKDHFGAGNLGCAIFYVVLECRFIPYDARVLVGIGISLSFKGPSPYPPRFDPDQASLAKGLISIKLSGARLVGSLRSTVIKLDERFCRTSSHSLSLERTAMYRFLCPRCRGQRTAACKLCGGRGKRLMGGIAVENCKACAGTGQQRCDVCGGVGEIDASDPKAA